MLEIRSKDWSQTLSKKENGDEARHANNPSVTFMLRIKFWDFVRGSWLSIKLHPVILLSKSIKFPKKEDKSRVKLFILMSFVETIKAFEWWATQCFEWNMRNQWQLYCTFLSGWKSRSRKDNFLSLLLPFVAFKVGPISKDYHLLQMKLHMLMISQFIQC